MGILMAFFSPILALIGILEIPFYGISSLVDIVSEWIDFFS